MKYWCAIIALCLLAAGASHAETMYPYGYIGLYSDNAHSSMRIEGTPFYTAEMWVWCSPGPNDMKCVEFAIQYPANVLGSTVTMNPAIYVTQGSLPTGISSCYSDCQTDWTWVAHQTVLVTSSVYGEVRAVPHPISGGPQAATCDPGYPLEPLTVLNALYVNCNSLTYPGPVLESISVASSNSVVAIFDAELSGAWAVAPHHFRVISNTIPPDTLDILSVTHPYGAVNPYRCVLLTFAESLVPGGTYTVEAEDICLERGGWCGYICCSFWCSDSEMQFIYSPFATLLQDFSVETASGGIEVRWRLSEADDDIDFLPMRIEKGSGEYEPLAADIERDGTLAYRVLDATARPGSSYRYRVDYATGGESRILFETEWIEVPAARSFLAQNAPNPFNPSTRIAFSLAEPAGASLRIYDVSGKLVRVLIDARLDAGPHEAEWDGRDASGRQVATGVYLYRLAAGAFIETRKMVLAR